ncbi:hypothetical protein D3C84_1067690 [compost metagenome]
MVGAVVLGRDPASASLEAHVDVFGDQHNGQLGFARVQINQLIDDDVVVQVFGKNDVRFGAFAHQN